MRQTSWSMSAQVLGALIGALLVVGCSAEATQRPMAGPAAAPPASAATPSASLAPKRNYPPSRRVDSADVLHDVRVEDPYRWLEDGDSKEVKAWLAAQGAYAREKLDALPGRAELVDRFRELFYVERVHPPIKRGQHYFWERKEAKAEKEAVYYRRGRQGEPKAILDPNRWSEDGSIALGSWTPSHDGRFVAYQVKKNNSDEATLEILEVRTGKVREQERIDGAKYSWRVSWTPGSDGFYYVWVPPLGGQVTVADRPGFAEVRFHRLGEDPAKDTVVRERTGDPTTFQGVSLSKNGRWLFTTVRHGWVASDLYFKDTRKGAKAPFTTIVEKKPHLYWVETYGDRFFVITDEGAPNWRVLEIDPARPERENWKEVIPERKDAVLDTMVVVGGRLGLGYVKDVVSELELRNFDGSLAHRVTLPGPGTSSELYGSEGDDEAYFAFESFTNPPEVHRLSVATGKSERVHRAAVPVDPSRFETKQVWSVSRDGTRIPMFVVAAKDQKLDGSAPVLLSAYGGFARIIGPSFSATAYPWLERGGVYAVANLRGGGEYGETWHRAGMRHKKQNVFDDFIASAEFLIKSGYTSSERLVIHGRSNGGLLVGAAIVQRPELFKVALCGVPLLDMVRYHLFGSGKTWIEEYGSADDPADFRALYAYSPYHHVKAGTHYPSFLMLTTDSDDRVDPMHARKFTALLQHASTGGPVLLRVETNAGHGGADKVMALVEERADLYAFALSEVAR